MKSSESHMPEPQAQVYEFGTFRVDTGKRLLFSRGGQALPLTPKAFDTLLYMLEHRERVLKKEELMKAIWPERVVEENNLNQNISLLRRVLGESKSEHQYIVTVPGRGYRFVAEVQTRSTPPEKPAPTVPAIAVLPFQPLVAEHRDLALELGMADTLIARLSGIRQIIVRPIGSVRKYADVDQDPLLAGRELGVESVLEGSIQRWGDSIRVTVRLMAVSTGAAMWTGTFDEKFSDIFAVQDAIAERVAAALAAQLGYEEKQRLGRRHTVSAEVYELYLKGRFHLVRLTPPEMQTAIGYFQRAIALDPSYAQAYLGLANALFRLPLAAELRPIKHYPKAKEAAQKALDIDGTLAEGHAILGLIMFWYEWNWSVSESHFKQALARDPNDAESHLGYAHLLSNTGRHLEALAEVKRARELNPLYLVANALESQFLLHAGRPDEALAKLNQTVALDALFWLTHLYYSSVYLESGRFAEAVAAANEAQRLSGGSAHAMAAGACALIKLGRRKEARTVLDELLKLSSQKYVPPYALALVYNALDEPEQAYAWLARGIDEKDPRVTFVKVEPKWNNLRATPEFIDIMRRVGFSDA
ncbi:MAG TPA: winged helix-turn-helix domain-containing protein [Xanthomonadales bacterium]|nr:winged helix-turn-helix domain-containing protein [Xanthomonadales bacterium]